MPRSAARQLAVGRGDGSYARLLTRLAKLDLLAIDDWMIGTAAATPSGATSLIEGHRGTGPNAPRPSSPGTLSCPSRRLARRHRRRQPSRTPSATACFTLDAHRIELQGRLDATDTPRPEDPHAGDEIEHPNAGLHPGNEARPGPARRQSRRGRPMDRAGGMENAHETLAARPARIGHAPSTGPNGAFRHRLAHPPASRRLDGTNAGDEIAACTRSTAARSLENAHSLRRVSHTTLHRQDHG